MLCHAVSMRPVSRPCLLAVSVSLLLAADTWDSKPVPQWTAEDAKQVLANSGWVKRASIGATAPARSESPGREGTKSGGRAQPSAPRTVTVRWESAPPIRSAEILAGEAGAPDWDGNYYAVSVSDVPGVTVTEKYLTAGLKRWSSLKVGGRKEIRPARVDVVLQPSGLVRVLYLFPRSNPITPEDQMVEFLAQIGAVNVVVRFELPAMQLMGKLQL